ncbi:MULTISPECIES: TetR/AcrR family transcriptional regulator [Streptacidiphilus]|uniref:TetR/AcrR family transcriptional regulator n=1 Tax=Streptacidiphilus cavernicola TaxID=3342716 RepID=A0ABV6UEB1_9ACTN|nr:TetR/AcrR family transcriptional regulator [Streptacidiphilus jeojiense]
MAARDVGSAQRPEGLEPEGSRSEGPRPPVWARSRSGGRGPQPSLSVPAIVTAAVALADAEGVDAVSMRRIAAELGVGTMSLYRYVETKDDLLDLMADQVMGEEGAVGPRTGRWRDDLRGIAVEYRRLMLRHPWVLPIAASRPPLGPNTLRRTEYLLGVMDGLGLDITAMSGLAGTVLGYVRGVVLTEIARTEVAGRTGLDGDRYRRSVGPYLTEVLATGQYPLLARFVALAEHDPDPDRTFEWGLERVLDGVAAGLEELRTEA